MILRCWHKNRAVVDSCLHNAATDCVLYLEQKADFHGIDGKLGHFLVQRIIRRHVCGVSGLAPRITHASMQGGEHPRLRQWDVYVGRLSPYDVTGRLEVTRAARVESSNERGIAGLRKRKEVLKGVSYESIHGVSHPR